jgi:hypothetical protein
MDETNEKEKVLENKEKIYSGSIFLLQKKFPFYNNSDEKIVISKHIDDNLEYYSDLPFRRRDDIDVLFENCPCIGGIDSRIVTGANA